MLKKNIKKVLIYLLVVNIGFTGYNLWSYYQYQEATKLRIDEFEKIEYDNIESLVESIDSEDFYKRKYPLSRNSVLNNYIYTITEDQIVGEFHEAIYSYNFENFRTNKSWLIYDLAINGEYCYYKEISKNDCYVSENEMKSSSKMISEPFRYLLFNLQVMNVDSTADSDYPKYYSTERSDLFLEAIDNAYIIGRGPDTPGYEEAIKWSYDLAKENGSDVSYFNFSAVYEEVTKANIDSLKQLKDMKIEEILADYNKYEDTLVAINALIKM